MNPTPSKRSMERGKELVKPCDTYCLRLSLQASHPSLCDQCEKLIQSFALAFDRLIEDCANVADLEFADASNEADRIEAMEDRQFVNGAVTKAEIVASLAHEAQRAYFIAEAIRLKLKGGEDENID